MKTRAVRIVKAAAAKQPDCSKRDVIKGEDAHRPAQIKNAGEPRRFAAVEKDAADEKTRENEEKVNPAPSEVGRRARPSQPGFVDTWKIIHDKVLPKHERDRDASQSIERRNAGRGSRRGSGIRPRRGSRTSEGRLCR